MDGVIRCLHELQLWVSCDRTEVISPQTTNLDTYAVKINRQIFTKGMKYLSRKESVLRQLCEVFVLFGSTSKWNETFSRKESILRQRMVEGNEKKLVFSKVSYGH